MARVVVGSRWTRAALVVVAVGLALWVLVPRRAEIGHGVASMGAFPVAAALVVVLGALIASMLVWRALLGALGSPIDVRAASQVVFVGQLGKYLPGSVWPVLAQMEIGAASKVPRSRTATASLLMLLVNLLAGLALAACILPFVAGDVSSYRWAFAAAPFLVAALHPWALNRLLAVVLRLVRRPQVELVIDGRGILRAIGWASLQWLLYGLQIGLLALRLGDPGPHLFLLAVGAFAFAWCVGFLVVLAPAGAGVREVVLVALLSPALGVGGATAVALVSRAVSTVADLLTAVLGAALGRGVVARARARVVEDQQARPAE